MRQTVQLSEINNITTIEPGISTTFATWDYNTNGLEKGKLTILCAQRNAGKTTISFQILSALAFQNVKVFAYFSETKPEDCKRYIGLSYASVGDIQAIDLPSGATRYVPKDHVYDNLDQFFQGKLSLYVDELSEYTFPPLLQAMRDALKDNVQVFILDSLMALENIDAHRVVADQQRIITELKMFALTNNVHVILIAHPSKAKGERSVAGSSRIENLADTVIFMERVHNNTDVTDWSDLANEIDGNRWGEVSSVFYFTKVRDGGTYHPQINKYDRMRNIAIDLTYLPKTQDIGKFYNEAGWYSLPARAEVIEESDAFI